MVQTFCARLTFINRTGFSYCTIKRAFPPPPQTKEIMNIKNILWARPILSSCYIHLTFSDWGSQNLFVSLTPQSSWHPERFWVYSAASPALLVFGQPAYLQLGLLVKALWVFYLQHCTYPLQNHHFQPNAKIVNLIDYLMIRVSTKCSIY